MTTDDHHPDQAVAPPVVAVVVVHEPGEWFDETLESLARQDYPNLNTLFLVTGAVDGAGAGGGDDLPARIRAVLPEAFVRLVEGGPSGGPGYGPTANAVLDVVEGGGGFFCLCHDDVALAPDAIRVMVEELYRANAGVVGPKLVTWDHAAVLQDVGLDVDRFAAAASRVEPGEYDQEQHDADVDVFAVPSACLLVRADLFRALGGFDPAMRFHGEAVDLCWRARITGARVIVAPAARVRHLGELELRRPDLNHAVLRARQRMRSTLTLTAGPRLPLRLVEICGLSVAEVVAGVATGHPGEAWASLRAALGAIPRLPTYLARRGTIAKLRPPTARAGDRAVDPTVGQYQCAGSNTLRSFARRRDMRTLIGAGHSVRRWRERSLVPFVTWALVVLAVLMASRTFINGSVPVIGELLPFPERVGDLWSAFRSGWNPRGVGATSANPTGLAALGAGSVLWLFDMDLSLTVLVVGLVLLGALGVWRLADLFPSTRERVVALATYVAMPIVPGVISTGRLGALVAYAAVPWFVHLLRLAVGIGTADPDSTNPDLVDGIAPPGGRERVRRTAGLGIVAALAVAVAPPVVLVGAGVVVVLGLTTLVVGAGWRTAAWITGTGLVAMAAAWVLNLPASATWRWDDLTAAPLAGPAGRGLVGVATMDVGQAPLGPLAVALYVPVLVGLVIARAWRLTWAARAAGLVLVFGALAVLADRDAVPVALPEAGYLLAPVALGLAVAAACTVASFRSDVAGGTFGWRQPLGLVALGAIAVGLFPSLLTVTDGAWYAPSTTLATLVEPQIRADPDFGDFRVLYLGDPRLLPGAVADLGDGVAMALTGPGRPSIADVWAAPETPADDTLRAALAAIAGNETQRGGRLLAPFAVRYVVVPVFDGAVSTPDHPVALPTGLLGALGSQLDLELRHSPPNYVLFENRSAFPGTALFTGTAAAATAGETPAELVHADLTAATPVLGATFADRRGDGEVTPGVLHLGVSFDDRWVLDVAGSRVPARPGFSVVTAYDIAGAGPAELAYDEPPSRRLALAGQAALWLLVVVMASRWRAPRWLSRPDRRLPTDGATIDLDDLEGAPP